MNTRICSILLGAAVLIATGSTLRADPQLTSWFTTDSGKYARIYATTANQTAGTSSTTWSRGAISQASPVYAGVNEVSYSASWVYVRTTGLASHVMGPWYLDTGKTQLFPNLPANTATLYRIPRTPSVPAVKTNTNGGVIGYFVNGVALFDNRDTFSYSHASGRDADPVAGIGLGDGVWNRDAYVNESASFDAALAHQAGSQYHYHVQPIALRYQLGDHVTYNSTANTYAESVAAVTQHSPILAWAADGHPVYGPYGYSDPTSAGSSVRRMVSGYVLRNGANGTTNLSATGRTTLPAWAAAAQNRPQTLAAAQYGPNVGAAYALGRYLEDYDHLGDLGYTQTTGATVRDFDLDRYNGRFCVTPEFPGGTYAYFSTLTATGAPAFPYNLGRQFYGSPTGGAVGSIAESVATQFLGGANSALTIPQPSVAGGVVTLSWSSVEGGTYAVDASPDHSAWTPEKGGLVSTGTTTGTTYSALGSSGTEYARVRRTALAAYDSTGQTAATVSQSAVQSYNADPLAPVISSSLAAAASQNVAFTYAISASNSPTSYGATGLPPGLTLDSVSGVISGAPTAAGVSTVTISATNSHATATAALTLTVASTAPVVTTGAATGVTGGAATLNGLVNPNGFATTVHFEYGLTTAYGTPTADQNAGSGTSAAAVQAALTGLSPGKPYHFRIVAVNASGTTYGADRVTLAVSTDMNNDGNADLVFQNGPGQIAVWYMNGAGAATSTAFISALPIGDWRVAGVGDLNGDGAADLVLQNGPGQIAVWYLNGAGTVAGSTFLFSGSLGDWRVVGVADMNGDSNADIIFQNAPGQVAAWYLNGAGAVTGSAFLHAGLLGDWRVVSVADVNGDGNADLVFQNTAGQIAVWYFNGAGTVTGSASLFGGSLGDWRVARVADVNGDGIPDIILQNRAGQVAAWYLDGAGAVTSDAFLYSGLLGDWRVR